VARALGDRVERWLAAPTWSARLGLEATFDRHLDLAPGADLASVVSDCGVVLSVLNVPMAKLALDSGVPCLL